MTTSFAVIVAAGKGVRMQSDTRKQYLELDGIPVLTRALTVFHRHPDIRGIVLVIPGHDKDYCRTRIVADHGLTEKVVLVAGGASRQESVANGIHRVRRLAESDDSLVLIHDGVRPFVSPDFLDRLMEKAAETGGCIPVAPISDTVKEIAENGKVLATLNRDRIFRAQTPQVFRLGLILSAFQRAESAGFTGTDDASIMEHAGIPVYTIPGKDTNIKLTTPDDLVAARAILNLS